MTRVPKKESVVNVLPIIKKSRQLPGCFFPAEYEKTMDRYYEHFTRLVREGKV